MTNQPQFEGMPEPREGIWPDYERPGASPLRVYDVQFSIRGLEEYGLDDELAQMMARRLFVGANLRLEVGVQIVGIAHKLSKTEGQAIGIAKGATTYVAPVEQGLAGHYVERIRRNGKAAEEFEAAANALSDELASFLGEHTSAGNEVPESLRKAHDTMRLRLFSLKEAQR